MRSYLEVVDCCRSCRIQDAQSETGASINYWIVPQLPGLVFHNQAFLEGMKGKE